jgi:two-component sensor histidine kinase
VHRRWEINSGLAIDSNGRAIGLNVIARDVTDQRAFEERQTLLIHELNHRVKNTLALVQALALQSFRAGRTPAQGQDAFQSRLASLAAAHDLLSREQWEGATLDELIADATRVYGEGPGRIHVAGPRVVVTPKAAIALVLALHELGTNAAKYGALSVPDGRVDLNWEIEDGRLRIEWRESGGPPVSAPSRRGFGLRMIERALASDLSGTATIVFAPEGLLCRIDAPSDGNMS